MRPQTLRTVGLSGVLAMLFGLVLTGPSTAASVAAQSSKDDLVTTTVSWVEPAAPQPGDTLVMAGTLHNASAEPLRDVSVFPRYSRDPLEERRDIRRVAEDPDYRSGRRDSEHGRLATDSLQPGSSVEWRLELPVDALRLGEPGIYVVGVDVRATRPDGARITAGEDRTVLPWLRGETLPSVSVALLWPLSATHPSVTTDGTHLDDELATEIASGGSLRELLNAANGTPVTWLVDPDLLKTLDSMTQGYTVRTAHGEQPGSGASDAASWLTTYDAATSESAILGLPYANPDVSALAHANPGRTVDVIRSAAAATRNDLRALTPDAATVEVVARPGGDAISSEAVSGLARGGVETVVVSDAAVAPTGAAPRVRLAANPAVDAQATIDAIRTDSGLDDAIADAARLPDAAAGSLELRQRMLAETAMAALAAQHAGVEPSPLVAAAPQGWRPDSLVTRAVIDTWITTSWVEPVPLSAVRQAPDRVRPVYRDRDRAAELTRDYLNGTGRVATLADRYLSTLADPAEEADRLERGLLRMDSVSARDHPLEATRLVNSTQDYLDTQLGKVRLRVPDSVTLSSRSGRFPITVENDLDQPVQVRLLLTPANRDRLSTEPVAPLNVAAGERQTIDVHAQAASNGRTPVDVALASPDGTEIGASQQVVVVASDYGAIGWVVIASAGALLFGAALYRLIRKSRKHPDGEPKSRVVEEEEVG